MNNLNKVHKDVFRDFGRAPRRVAIDAKGART